MHPQPKCVSSLLVINNNIFEWSWMKYDVNFCFAPTLHSTTTIFVPRKCWHFALEKKVLVISLKNNINNNNNTTIILKIFLTTSTAYIRALTPSLWSFCKYLRIILLCAFYWRRSITERISWLLNFQFTHIFFSTQTAMNGKEEQHTPQKSFENGLNSQTTHNSLVRLKMLLE